jgi:hypothetical protein
MYIGLNNLGLNQNNKFSPQNLFTGGVDGYFVDIVDNNTAYQDSAGTTAGAVDQPVGLRLDKSRGLARGAPVGTNMDFSSGLTSWASGVAGASTVTESGGVVSLNRSGGAANISRALFTIGTTYEVRVSMRGTAGGEQFRLDNGALLGGAVTLTTAFQTYTVGTFTAVNTTGYWNNLTDASTVQIDAIEILPLPGNHTTQSTAGSRPKLSDRYNLLSATSDFNDAANWTKFSATCTAESITEDTTAAIQHYVQKGTGSTGTHKLSFEFLQSVGSRNIVIRATGASGSAYVIYNPSTGAVVTSATTGTGHTIDSVDAASATSDGYFRGGITVISTESITCRIQLASGSSLTFDGDGVGTVLIRKPDVRLAADAALNIPAYQRVNTSTDYDTVGFPYYEEFDGTDDFRTSASGGGGTAGFFYCGAVYIGGGAGATRHLWSDAGTNIGYRLGINISNQLELVAGNGAAFTTVATTATLPVGETHVITAWDDGTNLNVQIDSGTVASVARPVVVAGTAGFTEGKSNASSSFYLTGRLGTRVYTKDYCPSAAVREQIKRYVAASAGLSL